MTRFPMDLLIFSPTIPPGSGTRSPFPPADSWRRSCSGEGTPSSDTWRGPGVAH
jgi:hypothetical protein